MKIKVNVLGSIRYSFTAQFIEGAALFAKKAHEIEDSLVSTLTEEAKTLHRSFVVSAIIQCSASLEAEISEIVEYGPGHHLGSNGIDEYAREFLRPLFNAIDSQSPLEKYKLVLHVLKRPALDSDGQIIENADLLVRLRNELIHYKSQWEVDQQKLFKRLKSLNFQKPGFVLSYSTFFPHECLSASLASWSVITASTFLDHFYEKLGFESRLEAYSERISVPPPKYKK